MKKLFLYAACLTMLASCMDTDLVDHNTGNAGKDGPISFVMQSKNMTRSTTDLQKTGHYNFGVFAYKSTDEVNNIMDNYLVGYNGTNVGYYMTSANQTTLGDGSGEYNGQSLWAYEMLGSSEYNYTGPDGYYTKDQTAYMSNEANQYLRYWDLSAPTTKFYAYAPYINSTAVTSGTATYTNKDHKLTIPNGSIVAKMVQEGESIDDCEYMVAATEVAKANYGKDVSLNFTRLNAKVNIKFWEDIPGYSVKILDLNDTYGVAAAPAVASGTTYTKTGAEYIASSGIVVDYTNIASPSFTWDASASKISTPLNFNAPVATEIGTARQEASASASTYYAIPKNNTTGFTFRVSYELTSTTGERIVVRNASVHVPVAYTNWLKNTHYTYIFKITRNTNGTTIDPSDPYFPTIDPTDPTVDEENALYPIVFDNCTVEDWLIDERDYVITNPVDTRDYSVVLSSTNFETGTKNIKAATGGTVTVNLYEDTDDITGSNTFTLTGPDLTKVTLSGSTVTVAAGATTGLYTITWTNTNTNKSPAETYSASFYVIGNYAVTTSTKFIGTNGSAVTTLQASTTLAGVTEGTPAGTFSIKFPASIPADKKSAVTISNAGLITVAPNAFAGTYSVVYTTDEGDAVANFEVVDYSFNLSTNIVGLSTSAQNVDITGAAALPTTGATSATSVYTISGTPATTKVTIDATTGQVTVAADAQTGKYTVTRTVTIDGSETVYTQEFAVKDVYTLSLSKYVIDNDDDYTITVTATKNGADNKSAVTYPSATGLTVDATAGTIKVLNTCAPGVYSVVNGTETVKFEVKD